MLIQAHHPAYITWESYPANEQPRAANDTRGGQRPAREDSALCQWIVRSGACERSMSTQYEAEGAHFNCAHSRADHIQTAACRRSSRTVDERVASRLLEALAHEEITVALAAADEVAERRARSSRALELRGERARYEAAGRSSSEAVCTTRPGTQNSRRLSVLAWRRCAVFSSGALPEALATGLMSNTNQRQQPAAQPSTNCSCSDGDRLATPCLRAARKQLGDAHRARGGGQAARAEIPKLLPSSMT